MKEILLFRLAKFAGAILLVVLVFRGCSYLTSSDKKDLAKRITPVEQIETSSSIYDDMPTEYSGTSKSKNTIKGDYADYITDLVDSVESDIKNRFKNQLPIDAINAINLKNENYVVDGVKQLISDQLAYLTRSMSINFSVLDSIDKIRYESDEKYRKEILNQLITLK